MGTMNSYEEEWEYPDPICMECGTSDSVTEVEEVHIGGMEYEQWCYCTMCDVETFHARQKPDGSPFYLD